MHLIFLATTLILAGVWRGCWQPHQGPWQQRWQSALLGFSLPPLMVVVAAIAVLWMGHHGTMIGHPVGPWGCYFSRGILLWAVIAVLVAGVKILWQGLRLRQYAPITLPSGDSARLLDTSLPFAAQVGLWQSSLIVSQGWLALSAAEQQAIFHHEQAHAHYRDPLCFWGLGIIRWLSLGLPQTQAIWNELLLLRELRADRWAATHVEPLLVAEVLVKVTQQWMTAPAPAVSSYAAFADGSNLSRLEQRVEALLSPADEPTPQPSPVWLVYWLLVVLPLCTIGLHH